VILYRPSAFIDVLLRCGMARPVQHADSPRIGTFAGIGATEREIRGVGASEWA
jgi:hypothetical protein